MKWIDVALVSGVALVAIGVGLNLKETVKSPKVEVIKKGVTPTVTVVINGDIYIDMEGEVLKPGVYKLAKGSRVAEAMAVCGGLSVNADREWVEKNINRAEMLRDGQKIYIPKIGNSKSQITISKQITNNKSKITNTEQILGTTINNGLVNINSAGVTDLDKLPGIGPALAQRIIEYREKNGGFKDAREINLVSGIGDKLFEKIKDLIEI